MQGETVVLVGAGAVGQVYGRHLQLGGAKVTFLVRPKYAEALRGGVDLYPLNDRRYRKTPVRWTEYDVVDDAEALRGRPFTQGWLCVSSTGLRGGDWFPGFADALDPAATLVCLPPGIEDRAYVEQWVDRTRIVSGLISLISYPAPLPGEDKPKPGVAYWFPPGPSPFSGPTARAEAIVAGLRAGKQPAKVVADATEQGAFGSAMLMPHMAALECAGWSFAALRSGRFLRWAADATKETVRIAARHRGVHPPMARRLANPTLMRLVTRLAPWFVPLDLETYLRVHFTKVGDQTRFALNTYRELGARYGLATPAVTRLAERLAAVDSAG